MKKNKNQKNCNIILIAALLFAVIAAFCGGVIYYQLHRTPKVQTSTAQSASSVKKSTAAVPKEEPEDAKAYYSENAKKLLAVISAKQSENVYSEKAVGKELSARGFGKIPITYTYTMDGNFEDEAQIDTTSATLHPQYTATYQTKSGEYWTVGVCNDCITAYPVTYNLEHNSGAEVILAEGESVTAYDSATNSFYEVIPKPAVLALKRIPAITAEALEKLSAQEIEKL